MPYGVASGPSTLEMNSAKLPLALFWKDAPPGAKHVVACAGGTQALQAHEISGWAHAEPSNVLPQQGSQLGK